MSRTHLELLELKNGLKPNFQSFNHLICISLNCCMAGTDHNHNFQIYIPKIPAKSNKHASSFSFFHLNFRNSWVSELLGLWNNFSNSIFSAFFLNIKISKRILHHEKFPERVPKGQVTVKVVCFFLRVDLTHPYAFHSFAYAKSLCLDMLTRCLREVFG